MSYGPMGTAQTGPSILCGSDGAMAVSFARPEYRAGHRPAG